MPAADHIPITHPPGSHHGRAVADPPPNDETPAPKGTGVSKINGAATYSPTRSPGQYHRRWRA